MREGMDDNSKIGVDSVKITCDNNTTAGPSSPLKLPDGSLAPGIGGKINENNAFFSIYNGEKDNSISPIIYLV